MPAITVVVPTRDREALLAQALESIRAQTLADWEAIVVDDGSSDATRELIERLAREDTRIRAVEREAGKRGANPCRNAGFLASRAPLVTFLDDDDLFSPECLEERVRAADRHPEVDFLVFPHRHFDREPGDSDSWRPAETRRDPLDRYLAVDIPWQTAGVTWRRESFQRLGPWREELLCWQDWELLVRALARGFRWRAESGPSFFHRRWSSSSGQSVSVRLDPARARSVARAIHLGTAELVEHRRLTRERRRLVLRLCDSAVRPLLAHGLRGEAEAFLAAMGELIPGRLSGLILGSAGRWLDRRGSRWVLRLLKRT